MPENEPHLDRIGASLRAGAGDPPPVFMGAVRRKRRRVAVFRAAGTLISVILVALIALAIALPSLRPPTPAPMADSTRARTALVVTPTAAMLRRFIDDPTVLDGPGESGSSERPVRAGERPDSDAARALLRLD